MTKTIVHLVRHGEVFNPDRLLYGRLPGFHLSSRGHSQARKTAESFRGHDITFLSASPLERAQETAQPIAEVSGLDILTDEGVIEAGNKYEGLRIKGVRSQLWHPKHWPLMFNPVEPSWGEAYNLIADRMMDAVERARVAALGHEAVIVSHQLPIVCVQRTVRQQALAHNPSQRQCELASVTSLVFQDDHCENIIYSEPAREI